MLNQERIQLMTKMAAYEENEGKKYMSIGSYFRSDYIGLQIIKSIICATIAYVILFGMYIFYDFEFFMQDLYKMDLLEFGRNVILYYFIFTLVYAVISYVVYSYRYHKAKKSLKKYYHHLKQLSAMYDLENRK
ncbi:MAG: hypothetical protein J6K58_09720 [Lachnospiraceae bacterium]|nr:hypothetical protein [Lachnospiraceae bacterium]